jgi:hypothetical protein
LLKTAVALEALTDAGDFEMLAVRCLRALYPECQELEHVGGNAKGQPIPDPLDAFCRVQDSQDLLFVMACCSLAADLNTKVERDIEKAAQEAITLRESFSNAKFRVFVCTTAEPSSRLMTRTYAFGAQRQIEVVFVGRSRLRDFLDTSPIGQYLRKQHLRLDCQMLSRDLMAELGARSLTRYAAEFVGFDADSFVANGSFGEASLSQRASGFCAIAGHSGSGKSAIAFLLLQRHLALGGLGIWIPAAAVETAPSLFDALRSTLQSLEPSLESAAGTACLSLCQPGETFLIVIDDISRSSQPVTVIKKVVAWSSPPSLKALASPPVMVVPVWEVYWDGWHKPKDAEWLREVRVRPWTSQESSEYLQNSGCCATTFPPITFGQEIVEELAGDPILLAIAVELMKDSAPLSKQSATDVIGTFIRRQVNDLPTGDHAEADVWSAILALTRYMLKERTLEPTWGAVRSDLSPQECSALLPILRIGSVCKLVGSPDNQHLRFRHDRLFQWLAGEVIKPLLRSCDSSEELLCDPFLAGYVGFALAASDASDAVPWLAQRSPLAIIEAVRYLRGVGAIQVEIMEAAREWLHLNAPRGSSIEFGHWLAGQMLAGVRSPLVLEVLPASYNRFFAIPRLLNGDFQETLRYVGGRHGFEPRVNSPRIEEALTRATTTHRSVAISRCTELLSKECPEEWEIRAALTITGFLQENALATAIVTAFDRSLFKEDILVLALWAALRCQATRQDLQPLLEIWSSIPDEDSEINASPRNEEGQCLGWVLSRLPIKSTSLLCEIADDWRKLANPLIICIEELFDPISVRFTAQKAAKNLATAKQQNHHGLWTMFLLRKWEGDSKKGPLPHNLSAIVREVSEDRELAVEERLAAEYLWISVATNASQLRHVDESNQRTAVLRRAKLGDASAVPHLITYLMEDHHWWPWARHVWCAELADWAGAEIGNLAANMAADPKRLTSSPHHSLAALLREIAHSDAVRLLEPHWEILCRSYPFFQLGLFLGSPFGLPQLRAALSQYARPQDAFTHVNLVLGFSTAEVAETVTQQHLDSLLPFLEFLDPMTLGDYVSAARKCGLEGYGGKVRAELDRRVAKADLEAKEREDLRRTAERVLPTDAELVQSLRHAATVEASGQPFIYGWRLRFENSQPLERLGDVLEGYLCSELTACGLRTVTKVLEGIGSRVDLSRLEKCYVSGDSSEIADLWALARLQVMRRSPT